MTPASSTTSVNIKKGDALCLGGLSMADILRIVDIMKHLGGEVPIAARRRIDELGESDPICREGKYIGWSKPNNAILLIEGDPHALGFLRRHFPGIIYRGRNVLRFLWETDPKEKFPWEYEDLLITECL